MHNEKTLLIVVNTAAFFRSHREPVALAARAAGYRVVVATADGPDSPVTEDSGLELRSVPLTRSGRNPFTELHSLASFIRLFREIRPDIVHLVTIKPVLYGGIAARLARVPAVVFAISGLGVVFSTSRGRRFDVTRFVAGILYRIALGHRNQRVIFQNPNDRRLLEELAGLAPEQTVMIPGSGVDLDEFAYTEEPDSAPVVVMAARLLREKGVNEFAAAARILKERGVTARFVLAGDPDPGNPSSVSAADVARWEEEGIVDVLGFRSDIGALFAASHVVVLPSYYGEGVPKVLLEAAACGRPVVTTDMPGCRDAIVPGDTGLLVPAKDPDALAEAMRALIEDGDRRRRMGLAARQLAEDRFGVEDVIEQHLATYEALSKRA
jgi:glycosyltransferase involved in cell wall biosynthesis